MGYKATITSQSKIYTKGEMKGLTKDYNRLVCAWGLGDSQPYPPEEVHQRKRGQENKLDVFYRTAVTSWAGPKVKMGYVPLMVAKRPC